MAANNTAALAALKAARNSVYAELAAHNNIDTTARAAEWADVTDALQTKLEDLVHSIASLSKPTATPTSEPRNSSVRSDVPKLDSSNPAADFPIYGSQVQTMAKQQGFDINDPDGLPIKERLTDPQESLLYGLLLQGLREAKLEYIVMRDNPKSSGTVAWRNLRAHFDSSSRATVTMLLHKLLSSPQNRSTLDFDKWLGNIMQQVERLSNIKGINLEDVLIAICVNQLPSTPEWAVFKNSLLNNTELTKTVFYTQCSSFARNEECRSSVQLQTPSTPTTAIAMVAQHQQQQEHWQQPFAMVAQQQQRLQCERCFGNHMTNDCRRTRNYSCAHCGREHYEQACPVMRAMASARQPISAAPRHMDRNQGRRNFNQPSYSHRPDRQAMVRSGGPAQPFHPHSGEEQPSQPGSGRQQQQQQQQQTAVPAPEPQRPDGAGIGWGRTSF